jgi:hypothetical protein
MIDNIWRQIEDAILDINRDMWRDWMEECRINLGLWIPFPFSFYSTPNIYEQTVTEIAINTARRYQNTTEDDDPPYSGA